MTPPPAHTPSPRHQGAGHRTPREPARTPPHTPATRPAAAEGAKSVVPRGQDPALRDRMNIAAAVLARAQRTGGRLPAEVPLPAGRRNTGGRA